MKPNESLQEVKATGNDAPLQTEKVNFEGIGIKKFIYGVVVVDSNIYCVFFHYLPKSQVFLTLIGQGVISTSFY